MLDHAILLPRGLTPSSARPKIMLVVARIEVESNAEVGVGCSPARNSCTTVPFFIQGEIAMVGTRIPSLSNVKPLEATLLSGEGTPLLGGATWSANPPCSS